MGITIAHLPIDTFNDDDELWITVNREAALQMDPGDQSEPDIITYKQVQLANKNWNDLLELHVEYWENGTMLQSCLDQLLTKREALAVEYILFAIDPFATSQIEKAQSNLPMLREATTKLGTNTGNNWSTSPISLCLQTMEQRECDVYNAMLEAKQINKERFSDMSTRSLRPLPSTIRVGVPTAGQTKNTQAPSKQDDHIESTAVDGDE
jgi:hypothetical protein